MSDFKAAETATEKRKAISKKTLAAAGCATLSACLAYAAVSRHYAAGAMQPEPTEKPQAADAAAGRPQETVRPAVRSVRIGTIAAAGHADALRQMQEEAARQRKVVEERIQLANALNWKRYVADEGIDGLPSSAPTDFKFAAVSSEEAAAQHQPQSGLQQEPPLAAAEERAAGDQSPHVVIQALRELPSFVPEQSQPQGNALAQTAAGNVSQDVAAQKEIVTPSTLPRQMQPPLPTNAIFAAAPVRTSPAVRMHAVALPAAASPPQPQEVLRSNASRAEKRIDARITKMSPEGTTETGETPVAAAVPVMPQQNWYARPPVQKKTRVVDAATGDQIVEEVISDQPAVISRVRAEEPAPAATGQSAH